MDSPQVAVAAADVPPIVHGRKATWFELFFDLVFVVAVAQLSGAYAHHYGWAATAGSVLVLLVLWWCWLGHTFHATRFDQERPGQRLLGLAQILAVTVIGYGASDAWGARAAALAGGVAAFKLLLTASYLAERRWRGARGLIRAYAGLYLLQAAVWAASAWLEPGPRLAAWCTALALDLASPWWVARYTTSVRPHPEHLPERFGLFTIILLGEGMAAVVHAWDHAGGAHPQAVAAALLGAALSFLTWLGYFEVTRAHGERRAEDASDGRRLRLWAYGHVPLYVGVVSLAAGTVALSVADSVAPVLGPYLAGLALIPVGLLAIRASTRGGT